MFASDACRTVARRTVARRTVVRRSITAVAVVAVSLVAACKNPIDVALDKALDFSGVYKAADGLEVEFSGSEAVVTKLGTTTFSIPLQVGDKYMVSMYPTDTPNTFQGYARSKTGFLDNANVVINGSTMTISRPFSTSPIGQDSFTKIGPVRTPSGGTGGTGGTGGSTSTTCAAQWAPVLAGSWHSTSMVIDGTGEVGGTGALALTATIDFGATSFKKVDKRNNGTGTVYNYVGSYVVQSDASAGLVGGNRCSIVSSWLFNGSTNGTTTFKILAYSGGVLDISEPGIRYKMVR